MPLYRRPRSAGFLCHHRLPAVGVPPLPKCEGLSQQFRMVRVSTPTLQHLLNLHTLYEQVALHRTYSLVKSPPARAVGIMLFKAGFLVLPKAIDAICNAVVAAVSRPLCACWAGRSSTARREGCLHVQSRRIFVQAALIFEKGLFFVALMP